MNIESYYMKKGPCQSTSPFVIIPSKCHKNLVYNELNQNNLMYQFFNFGKM